MIRYWTERLSTRTQPGGYLMHTSKIISSRVRALALLLLSGMLLHSCAGGPATLADGVPDAVPPKAMKDPKELAIRGNTRNADLVEKQELKVIRTPDVIFVPTPYDVMDRMLKLAKVKKDDLLYDLGCGDGRIVVTSAKEYGCKSVGFDIDPQRVKESLENVERNNVGHLVRIEQQDIFTLDLSEADVITLYLLRSLNTRLIPQLEKLKPGSRIVSHDYDMRGVKPDEAITLYSSEDDHEHSIFLWTTPLKQGRGKRRISRQ